MAGFEVGIIATIFFGGLAGWLAGKLMDMRKRGEPKQEFKSEHALVGEN